MTTIAIERELLERVSALLDEYDAEEFDSATVSDVRAALAAPATAPEPVAWLAHYVGRSGMEQEYVSTDKNLADENDASGKALPLYLHPPATAPAQPEIVDLLAEMYELILANKVVLAEKSGGVWTWPDRAIEAVRKHRSGPAQPERTPMTDEDTLALFNRIQRKMRFTDADAKPFASGVASAEFFHGIKEDKP